MELKDLLPGIIGSFVGVMGWLLVGLYIQRRQFMRQARNAAKAVYFELHVNLTAVSVAVNHGSFVDLDRGSFERLLPELATLLSAEDLDEVVGAYMTHAGYRQLSGQEALPADVRRPALEAIARAHERALDTLRSRAFTTREAAAIQTREAATHSGAAAAPLGRKAS
jgi:hypothetical protein